MICQHKKNYLHVFSISLVVDIKFKLKVHFHSAAMSFFFLYCTGIMSSQSCRLFQIPIPVLNFMAVYYVSL